MKNIDKNSNLVTTLKARGAFQDSSHEEQLIKELETNCLTFYCGFDPTSDSLHVGNLLPLITLMRIIKSGHKVIVLIGTATGMIGDPSGKSSERTLLDSSVIIKNAKSISNQITSIFSSAGINSDQFISVNNHEWLNEISLISFLRDFGKHFSVNQMIAKDSVKQRLTEREQGISFTEFSYMALQAYDFYHLYSKHNCRIQIGGSDQWGNITSGLDLIKKLIPNAPQAFGITMPLITDSNGRKFGKSEAGAIWLSAEKTSTYSFRQFWLNIGDQDAIQYLILFTNLSLEEIHDISVEHFNNPENRIAQIRLADEMTNLVHGEIANSEAKKTSQALFSNEEISLDLNHLKAISLDLPTVTIKAEEVISKSTQEILVIAKACSSKSAARKLIEGGGAYFNNKRLTDPFLKLEKEDFIEEQALLLRTGKKNYFMIFLENS